MEPERILPAQELAERSVLIMAACMKPIYRSPKRLLEMALGPKLLLRLCEALAQEELNHCSFKGLFLPLLKTPTLRKHRSQPLVAVVHPVSCQWQRP
jgi:hypothetical protein